MLDIWALNMVSYRAGGYRSTEFVYCGLAFMVKKMPSKCVYGKSSLLLLVLCLPLSPAVQLSAQSERVPPELMEELLALKTAAAPAAAVAPGELSAGRRIGLLFIAAATIFAATVVCRYLARRPGGPISREAVFLVFAVFGAVAAIPIAAAAAGSVYLHLTVAAAAVISGFSVCFVILSQVNAASRFLIGPCHGERAR